MASTAYLSRNIMHVSLSNLPVLSRLGLIYLTSVVNKLCVTGLTVSEHIKIARLVTKLNVTSCRKNR